jgi:hypothetical protein
VSLLRRLGKDEDGVFAPARVCFDTTVVNIHNMEREGYTVMRSH